MPRVEIGEFDCPLDIVGSVLASPDDPGLTVSPTLITVVRI
jgi:hypothetical protein